jgi:hypothetical protein
MVEPHHTLFTMRETRWDAPTIHQLIFSWSLIIFGASELLGKPLDLAGLPSPCLLFNPAAESLAIIFGAIGVLTAFYSTATPLHVLRLCYAVFNWAFYSILSWIFAARFRVGTIVYPMVMLWSIWLLVRIVYDRRITVEIIEVLNKRRDAPQR